MLRVKILKELSNSKNINSVCHNIYGADVLEFVDLLDFSNALSDLVRKKIVKYSSYCRGVNYIVTKLGQKLALEPEDIIRGYLDSPDLFNSGSFHQVYFL